MTKKQKTILSSTDVSKELDVTVTTLFTWYKFWEDPECEKPEDMPPLPEYGRRWEGGPKYWKREDLDALIRFRDWVPRGRNGLMGKYNRYKWSK